MAQAETGHVLSVQVNEQVVSLSLPDRERTTAAEVVLQLLRQTHLSEQLVGKRVRLIFSGRVLDSTDVIGLIVPTGAVVQCAIQDEGMSRGRDDDDDDDEGDVEALVDTIRRRPARRTPVATAEHAKSDFVVGFSMGFVVGPLMCFWLLEQGPPAQKMGILAGIVSRSLLREYRELALFSVSPQGADNEPSERNSFELV
ncbi:hypothetical protein BASA81_001603 [Batrachochytrium salamandrivorans]|nr:hypothetical protein BASA81_001603 [Batrachochytrium salamandrivorans]